MRIVKDNAQVASQEATSGVFRTHVLLSRNLQILAVTLSTQVSCALFTVDNRLTVVVQVNYENFPEIQW